MADYISGVAGCVGFDALCPSGSASSWPIDATTRMIVVQASLSPLRPSRTLTPNNLLPFATPLQLLLNPSNPPHPVTRALEKVTLVYQESSKHALSKVQVSILSLDRKLVHHPHYHSDYRHLPYPNASIMAAHPLNPLGAPIPRWARQVRVNPSHPHEPVCLPQPPVTKRRVPFETKPINSSNRKRYLNT